MLELQKKGLFSKEYIAREDGADVAELIRPRWRYQGEIIVGGSSFKVETQGFWKNAYVLYDGDLPIMEVKQPSCWRSRFVFRFNKMDYEIVNKAWYSSILLVRAGEADVGSIERTGLIVDKVRTGLPDSLPVAVRVFLCWVAMVRWDQANARAASAGGATG